MKPRKNLKVVEICTKVYAHILLAWRSFSFASDFVFCCRLCLGVDFGCVLDGKHVVLNVVQYCIGDW